MKKALKFVCNAGKCFLIYEGLIWAFVGLGRYMNDEDHGKFEGMDGGETTGVLLSEACAGWRALFPRK